MTVNDYTGHATSNLGRYKLCREPTVRHALLRSPVQPYMILESQQWRTPKWVIKKVCGFLGIKSFDLDACADRESSVAPKFFSTEKSCLTHEWDVHSGASVWMNPPFGQRGVPKKRLREAGLDPKEFAPFPGVDVFIQRAKDQACQHNLTVAVCIPTATDTKRLKLVWDADLELCLGRVAFEDLDGKPQKSPPGGHSVYVWEGRFGNGLHPRRGPTRYLLPPPKSIVG